MFPLLAEFTQKLLMLPHSSANVERLFSSINLMKTNIRNKLSTDTLSGLLHTKGGLKINQEPSQEQIKHLNKYMYKFYLSELFDFQLNNNKIKNRSFIRKFI